MRDGVGEGGRDISLFTTHATMFAFSFNELLLANA